MDFPARCALLVEQYCEALRDFTGERAPPTALDIGCAVGASTFELSRAGFGAVMGLDYSNAFIAAASTMKEDGFMMYQSAVEGDITVRELDVFQLIYLSSHPASFSISHTIPFKDEDIQSLEYRLCIRSSVMCQSRYNSEVSFVTCARSGKHQLLNGTHQHHISLALPFLR